MGQPAGVERWRKELDGLANFERVGMEQGSNPAQGTFQWGREHSPNPDPIGARRVRELDPDLAGSCDSGVGRVDSCTIGSGQRNYNIIGRNSGSIASAQ